MSYFTINIEELQEEGSPSSWSRYAACNKNECQNKGSTSSSGSECMLRRKLLEVVAIFQVAWISIVDEEKAQQLHRTAYNWFPALSCPEVYYSYFFQRPCWWATEKILKQGHKMNKHLFVVHLVWRTANNLKTNRQKKKKFDIPFLQTTLGPYTISLVLIPVANTWW